MKYLVTQLLITISVVALLASGCASGCASKDSASSSLAETSSITQTRSLATSETTATIEPNATIKEVIDGDTLIVKIAGSSENVRLIGIDTPESVARNRPEQCFGKEASDYLKSLLPKDTKVTLILDQEARDQYDRLLAYVFRSKDELFINLDLVEKGYAGTLSYPPNIYYKQLFDSAVKKAARDRLGLWRACGDPDVPLQ